MSNSNSGAADPTSDVAVKALNKRFESLVSARAKAVKGKGAWYWAHLEPTLIKNPETNLPKAVKLNCILCNALFSASNPSRTASEHLKRGTCPNFSMMSRHVSELPPLASPSSQQCCRKRSSHSQQQAIGSSYNVFDSPRLGCEPSITRAETASFSPKPLTLSGGKCDLRPLEQLQNSVKKLKSPKALPCPDLNKDRANAALSLLADWFYESCGSVSLSSLEHPKFKTFLNHVGLPDVSKSDFSGARLESKYEEARVESAARINDAAFFQIACEGWNGTSCGDTTDRCLIKFTVNLPNATQVFHKAVYSETVKVPLQHAVEVLWETVREICGNNVQKCVGIVADKYKAKALRNLELENQWMDNVHCQLRAMVSLINDFFEELPLFRTVSEKCIKVANLINSTPHIRTSFHKFRMEGVELPGFIRVPSSNHETPINFKPFTAMLEDLLNCCRFLHLVVLDDAFKATYLSDTNAREVMDLIHDFSFWNEVESAHSLVKLIVETAREIESERPLISQCLRLWDGLRKKLKDWCSKFNFHKGHIEKIVEARFIKNYHPSWSAAFVLDPLYLIRDSSGKYLPPFKCLTHEQEKDVDKLITRLVPREEAHVAVMELMKWRSEGLDPLYAQAVQLKQRDPLTGKMKIANPHSSRLVWETCLKEFKTLGKVAVRLLFLRATSCGVKFDDWASMMRLFSGRKNSRDGLERAHKLAFVAAHAKLRRRNFLSSEDQDDAVGDEIFGSSGEDDMRNEVIAVNSPI